MPVTRRQIRLTISIVATVLWAFVFAALWGSTSIRAGQQSFVVLPNGETVYAVTTRNFGINEWLMVVTHNPTAPGSTGPGSQTEWFVRPDGLWMTLLATVGVTIVALLLHRFLVSRLRYLSICDECRYDLTGLESDACPECGHPLPDDAPQHKTPKAQ